MLGEIFWHTQDIPEVAVMFMLNDLTVLLKYRVKGELELYTGGRELIECQGMLIETFRKG
jgi:hypothetical protein